MLNVCSQATSIRYGLVKQVSSPARFDDGEGESLTEFQPKMLASDRSGESLAARLAPSTIKRADLRIAPNGVDSRTARRKSTPLMVGPQGRKTAAGRGLPLMGEALSWHMHG